MHEHLADAFERRGGEVGRPRRAARVDDDDVGAGERDAHRPFERVEVVGDALQRDRLAAVAPHAGGEQHRVRIDDRAARRGLDRRVDEFVTAGQDRDARQADDLDLREARAGGRRQVGRTEQAPLGDDGLGRDDVLADRPDVVKGATALRTATIPAPRRSTSSIMTTASAHGGRGSPVSTSTASTPRRSSRGAVSRAPAVAAERTAIPSIAQAW